MPNLVQSAAFREKYRSSISTRNKVGINEIGYILENFNTPKSNLERGFIKRGYSLTILEYLEGQKEANCVLVFVDITSFSNKASLMSNNQLSRYLDEFYDSTIPIIYSYGGEVEKIIGDGIIFLFGLPFIEGDKSKLLDLADKCSKSIIRKHSESPFEVKIAIHDGLVQYYKNKTSYTEYTVIGQPLTDLFRLEGISKSNSLNYFVETGYDRKFRSNHEYTFLKNPAEMTTWVKSGKLPVDLKGCKYRFARNYEMSQETKDFIGDYIYSNIDKDFNDIVEIELIEPSDQTQVGVHIDSFVQTDLTILSIKMKTKDGFLKAADIALVDNIYPIIAESKIFFKLVREGRHYNVVYRTPLKTDIDEVFRICAKISSIFTYFKKMSSQHNIDFEFGIGLSYGKVFISEIGNQIRYNNLTGRSVNEAMNLSNKFTDKVAVSSVIYKNLNEHNKSILYYDGNNNCYVNSIFNVMLNKYLDGKS